jgi:predicted RNA-binding Zn ribbon-like protein
MVWSEFACIDFVNSEFNDHTGGGLRFDRLPIGEWQQAFLDRWHWQARVPAGATHLAELRRLRSRLRGVLERVPAANALDRNVINYLNRNLASAYFVFKLEILGGLKIEPLNRTWTSVMAELVRSTVEVLTTQDPRRLKVCANPDCSWMFYDESMNRSRRWCQANYCGNLIKVREFRARRAPGTATKVGR